MTNCGHNKITFGDQTEITDPYPRVPVFFFNSPPFQLGFKGKFSRVYVFVAVPIPVVVIISVVVNVNVFLFTLG